MSESTEELRELLIEIRNWVRIGFRKDAKDVLIDILNTDKKRRAYQMTDGHARRDDIRKACGMSPNSLLDLWRDCDDAGLMEVMPDGKRRRLFDLSKFGLLGQDLPEG
jgi:hypothetical protein